MQLGGAGHGAAGSRFPLCKSPRETSLQSLGAHSNRTSPPCSRGGTQRKAWPLGEPHSWCEMGKGKDKEGCRFPGEAGRAQRPAAFRTPHIPAVPYMVTLNHLGLCPQASQVSGRSGPHLGPPGRPEPGRWCCGGHYLRGCLSSNRPVPPLTTFPTTMQAEGDLSSSCDPGKHKSSLDG